VSGKDVTIDRDGDITTLKDVDKIVVAVGTEPNRTLQRELADKPYEVHVIGDCQAAAGIMEAVAAGAEVGRQL
jgi:hypothetical protein